MQSDKWFYQPEPNPNAKSRLFCFHYAGGSAQVFRKWGPALKSICEVIAVQLPGRGERLGEKLYTQVDSLIKDLYPAFAPLLDKPYAMYAHSLGGIVAFEMARRIAQEKVQQPSALFIGSRVSPDIIPDKPRLTDLPEDAFIKGVTARWGANAGMALMEDPEIRALFMPTLRADIELYENYLYNGPDKLAFPLFTLRGKTDHSVKAEDVAGWQKYAGGGYEFREMSGGHFFWQDNDAELMSLLKEKL